MSVLYPPPCPPPWKPLTSALSPVPWGGFPECCAAVTGVDTTLADELLSLSSLQLGIGVSLHNFPAHTSLLHLAPVPLSEPQHHGILFFSFTH